MFVPARSFTVNGSSGSDIPTSECIERIGSTQKTPNEESAVRSGNRTRVRTLKGRFFKASLTAQVSCCTDGSTFSSIDFLNINTYGLRRGAT